MESFFISIYRTFESLLVEYSAGQHPERGLCIPELGGLVDSHLFGLYKHHFIDVVLARSTVHVRRGSGRSWARETSLMWVTLCFMGGVYASGMGYFPGFWAPGALLVLSPLPGLFLRARVPS